MTTLCVVALGCLRNSVASVLVLIISMGSGVVVPYLGAVLHKARPSMRAGWAGPCDAIAGLAL